MTLRELDHLREFAELVELMRLWQIAAACTEKPTVINTAGQLEHAVDEFLFELSERQVEKDSCTVGWHTSRCLGSVGSNPAPTTEDHRRGS